MTTATSQIQKHFQMHNIYRRSKNLYDIEKINYQEHIQEINRRKPQASVDALDIRVDSSFLNAATLATQKINQHISECKKRYHDETEAQTSADTLHKHFAESEDDSYVYEQVLERSKSKIKAPDLRKLLSRKSFEGSKPAYSNEDQFNNFADFSPRKKPQIDFDLCSPRNSPQRNPQKTLGDAQLKSDLTKTYEKNLFNSSVYKCLFDYSKVDKYGKISKSDKSQKKIKPIENQKLLSCEKSLRINQNPVIGEFYFMIGKDSPTQMNYRYNKSNQFYFSRAAQRHQTQDYSARKMKQEMVDKRKLEINNKKVQNDSRDQLCDKKFFSRQFFRAHPNQTNFLH